jgi:hypothetical protein
MIVSTKDNCWLFQFEDLQIGMFIQVEDLFLDIYLCETEHIQHSWISISLVVIAFPSSNKLINSKPMEDDILEAKSDGEQDRTEGNANVQQDPLNRFLVTNDIPDNK